MTEYWRRALNKNLVVKEDSVDFRIEFDQISHQVLMKKLQTLGTGVVKIVLHLSQEN